MLADGFRCCYDYFLSTSLFVSLYINSLFIARISVNGSNVQSLLDAANQYQIEPVKKMCVEFLKGQIDATNCLGENIPDEIKPIHLAKG